MQNDFCACLLNDSFPPQIDGVENVVVNYADIINKKYGRSVVAVPKFPNSDDSAFDFPVVRYPSLKAPKMTSYRAGYPFDKNAMADIEAFNPSVIHSHCPIASTLFARALREDLDAPLILTYHTKFDIEINKAIEWNLLRKAAVKCLVTNIEACDEVWVVSKGAGENLNRMGYRGSWRVMENGVDFEKFRAPEKEVFELRQKYGIKDKQPVFLFVGRMMWYKGQKITLQALKTAASDGYDFKMFFVGGGDEKEQIENFAKSIGIADRCIFTGPIHDREELRKFYSMADLFLFPSTFDTNGIVVREAAACGLGSVLIRNSCAAEGIDDGHNGIFIDENPASMAQVIKDACSNLDRLHEIGENAMNEIYVSWDEAVEKAYSRYNEVIEEHKQGKLMHCDSRNDSFFTLVAEVNGAIRRVEEVTGKIVSKMEEW